MLQNTNINVRTLFTRFGADTSGNIAVVGALMTLPILGLTGMSLDLRTTNDSRSLVQENLDAAVLASTKTLLDGGAIGEAKAALIKYMEPIQSLQGRGLSCRMTEFYSNEEASAIFANYDCSQKTNFVAAAGFKELKFQTRSRAHFRLASTGCVLALGPSSVGVQVSGSTSVTVEGCSVVSNVPGSNSVIVGGSATLTAGCVSGAGDIYSVSHITLTECVDVKPNDTSIYDPYKNLEIIEDVSAMPCQTPVKVNRNEYFLPSGRYCRSVVMRELLVLETGGTFFFDGVDLDMKSGSAVLEGEDVTIIFMNDGEFNNSNSGEVHLSAKTEGHWAGILMYADRHTTSTWASMKITGNSTSVFQGLIYMPGVGIEYRGGAATSGGCTQIIGKSVDFNGAASLQSNCEGMGLKGWGPAEALYIDL